MERKTGSCIGEWIIKPRYDSVSDYKALAGKFNPTGFNAHDIVALAKAAGMKYIVITSKYRDGFAMFDSEADPFNIVGATPFHHDPIARGTVPPYLELRMHKSALPSVHFCTGTPLSDHDCRALQTSSAPPRKRSPMGELLNLRCLFCPPRRPFSAQPFC